MERTPLVGCDELLKWAEKNGFRASKELLPQTGNECNWYAYKRSTLAARECECNGGKPMQIVILPFSYTHLGQTHESVTVEITGEVNSLWFNQECYALETSELMSRFGEIERMLVSAWNALAPISVTV